ncbi:LysE family translocator [Rhodophyticola sp. CCM32]|uniref:LysE family transporter n=1 Tax=Rhodophyticola sp. CCM32 TaxID=2916397 RepID=UPI00107F2047|nr:LysE family transporter [Rhodophyticola sp. CCM32]QBY02292.1 LysE family translocator [Rhodophyticola sp. CCM32]
MSDPAFLAAATSVATFAFAAGSPGPATLAVAATSMAGGRGRGLAMAAGLSVGLAIWGVAVALGFGALVAQSASILVVLKLLGAVYLFYLAVKSGQSALRSGAAADTAPAVADARQLFRRGLMLNLSNPKAVLAWVAALALGTDGTGQAMVVPIAVVAICAGLGGGLYAGYATLFSRRAVMAGYVRFRRWIEGVFAALFALAAIRLVLWRNA